MHQKHRKRQTSWPYGEKNTQTKLKSAVPIAPVRTAHVCAYNWVRCGTQIQHWKLQFWQSSLLTSRQLSQLLGTKLLVLSIVSAFKQLKNSVYGKVVRHFALRLRTSSISLRYWRWSSCYSIIIVHCPACRHTTASVSSVNSVL